jgi:hypothetical protein
MKPRRYRKRRNARALRYNPWNMESEPGDLMVNHMGQVFRLETPGGWGARTAGLLYPRFIRPPAGYGKAEIREGEIYWLPLEPAP